jgi:hypothetical protein
MDIQTLVENDDILRPQTTFGYKTGWASKPFDFPNLYITESFPIKTWNPIDTYADDVNKRFEERYGKK